MKAFTFLGKGPLHKSNYVFETQEWETQFFAEAIVKFFEPESLYIFATDLAAKEPVSEENKCERLTYLENLLHGKTTVKHIPIKDGSDETELWDIFGTVVHNIDDNDTVLFDITHGFRSLPFLTFLALAYVSHVKSNVTIEKVIYGAYDAVERQNPDKPVFDLTPFVSLLGWMNAFTIFQRYGDARPIADLDDVPGDIGTALTDLSAALLTNRTLEAQEAAMKFNTEFSAIPVTEQTPFIMLVDKLQESYEEMAVYEPHTKREGSLRKQYMQIKWYVENQHYLQAITLMREWLISYECRNHTGDWLSQGTRRDTENALNEQRQHQDSPFAQLVENQQVNIELWEKCNNIRKDLAHCGMRHRPQSAKEAIKAITTLFEEFETFVQSCQLG